jgi:multiple sugar transport system ATP-binding protein
MASVTYKNVTKKFGDVTALQNLDIKIADKEFLVLVGPSGCGKTTALRCLAGLEEATSGDILIDDKVVNNIAPKDRDIAMVFQSYALYPHMTVYDNMAFGLKLRHVPKDKIKQRVEEAARIMDIEDLLKRKPRELSGGQRQRVAVGRAIVREPKVFLFDEPLSNLDAKLRVQMRTEISKIHNRLATTFIYVTHDQTEAMTMASRIAVMNKGILQQLDTPQTLYDHPKNLFVAGFIGSPAMNFFKGSIRSHDNTMFFNTGKLWMKIPPKRREILQKLMNKDVIYGIRPENIYNPEYTPPGSDVELVEAKVEVTELMGNEIFLYLKAEDTSFVARVDPRTHFGIGETAKLAFNMNLFHIFDASTDPDNPIAVF